jgi:hypothetical protein
VEASNSCAGNLIFDFFLFIVFCQGFFTPFHFFLAYRFIVFSPFVELVFIFIVLHFASSFLTLFYSCFFTHVVLSLIYPTCLGLKELVIVV